jgi:hypothetical protein
MDRATTLDPEVAARYLEGGLSTEEADAFESEYLGAPEYRRHLEDEGLLERYLRRSLSGPELEAVEKALLADPELLDQIDKLAAIEQGLADLRASGDYVPPARRPHSMSLLRSPQYARAASIAAAGLLVFSGYLFVDNRNLQSEIDSFVNSPVTRTIPLVTTRGAETANRLPPPDTGVLTTLQLDATYFGNGGLVWFDNYRGVVTRTSDGAPTVIFERDGLPLNGDDTVAVTISDRLLVSGSYEVQLDARDNDWPADQDFVSITRYTFEITEPE